MLEKVNIGWRRSVSPWAAIVGTSHPTPPHDFLAHLGAFSLHLCKKCVSKPNSSFLPICIRSHPHTAPISQNVPVRLQKFSKSSSGALRIPETRFSKKKFLKFLKIFQQVPPTQSTQSKQGLWEKSSNAFSGISRRLGAWGTLLCKKCVARPNSSFLHISIRSHPHRCPVSQNVPVRLKKISKSSSGALHIPWTLVPKISQDPHTQSMSMGRVRRLPCTRVWRKTSSRPSWTFFRNFHHQQTQCGSMRLEKS
jgi:hypothetical protein